MRPQMSRDCVVARRCRAAVVATVRYARISGDRANWMAAADPLGDGMGGAN